MNNDKYDINRAWCGSPFIYSVEYKCTREETPQTTISIVVESESKQKPQFTIKRSDDNQEAKKMLQLDPKTAVSWRAKRERKKDIKIALVDNKQEPEVPIKRPKQAQERKLKKGNNKIQRYIDNKYYIRSVILYL